MPPSAGTVTYSGGLGVMRQFVAGDRTIAELLLSVAPDRVRMGAEALREAEARLGEDEAGQLAYAEAINDYTKAGGYDIEVVWDACTTAAIDMPYDQVRDLPRPPRRCSPTSAAAGSPPTSTAI